MDQIKSEDTFQKVIKILSSYTDFKLESMKMDSRLTSDLGLTSFDLICLSTTLEDAFGVKLDDQRLSSIQTIQDVCQVAMTN